MEALSPQEWALLRFLQKDSRFDINDLMKQLNMSRTTVYERIKK
ncbi:MAG TPA: AsnC family transcriptional regulator, partial [Runella sp.]|nr:AsnC family transcriptional regulator [Runella sp.]